MTAKPKILIVRDPVTQGDPLPFDSEGYELEEVRSPLRALARMGREQYAGIFVAAGHIGEAFGIGKLLQNEQHSGGHARRHRSCSTPTTRSSGATAGCASGLGTNRSSAMNFYAALNSPEILGPDFCPFHSALDDRQRQQLDAAFGATTATSKCTSPRFPRRASRRSI